MAKKLKLY